MDVDDGPEQSPDDAPSALAELVTVMRRLRAPEADVRWARERTFPDIASHTIEEAYEVADAAERNDLAALADELGALPVAEADRGEVARWVDDWHTFAAYGHRYAEAIRRRDGQAQGRIAGESNDPAERIYRFAAGNGVDACVLRVELPARRSAI